jgi:hypothetical protein
MLFAFVFLLSVAFAFQWVLAFRKQDGLSASNDGTFYGSNQTASWRKLARVPLLLLAVGTCAWPASAQTITTQNLGANLVTLNLTATAAGTGYFTLLSGASATCGTATQTAAGQDSTGTAARNGSLTLAANTAGQYTVRNLAGGAAYTVCFTPNGSTAPVSNSFSTTSAATYTAPSWSAVGAAGFSAGAASYESLSFSPAGTPYLAYEDGSNGSKATVMRFNGSAWEAVGAAGFSAGAASYESLSFSPNGTPYLAYEDGNKSYKATVMSFNGSSWEVVGTAGFSANAANEGSLSFSPNGTPYLAYSDAGNSNKATVMKFNGSSWAVVGAVGFSGGEADNESLSFSPDGTPYLAYSDYSNGGNSGNATVMKFNGSSWAVVGAADFSAGLTTSESLSFSPDGTPYLAYYDGGNSGNATVMKFNGSSWEVVGAAGFSAGTAYYESLSFSPDGTPYLAYCDYGNSKKATVMRFNGSSWAVVGVAGFSAGGTGYESFSFSPDGTPYLAYVDLGNSNKATVMRVENGGPSATTGSATALTSSSATLNGTVNDNGTATTVTFDYGTTTSYGTNVAATTGGTIAAGTGSTAVSVALTGLQVNTSYHFRVNATASGTTVNGSDATFTTDKTTPSVSVWPSASSIVFGQTLASSLLSGGAASVAGTFTWNDSTIVPTLGTASYSVTFTPSDTADYATVSNTVSVTALAVTGSIGTANLGANQVTLQLTSNAAGTGYFTLLSGSSATCGTAAQTVAGQDSTGTAARNGSLVLATNTAANYTVRNLSQSAAYTICFTPNGSTAPVSSGFSTTSEATYAAPLWTAVGSAGFSGGTADYESLSFSPDGTPYLAYADGGNSVKATVMKFNGSSWVVVGSAGFSAGATSYESLSFSPDGTPYVAYYDAGNSNKATVMRFNGSSWEVVGTAGFSAGPALYDSLSFSPDGTPYLAYQDGNSTKATVMRFNGSSWEVVGAASFSAGTASFDSLSFSPDGTPYLAYEDAGNSFKATVMRFNGSSWEVVGTAGFSTSTANYESLSFSPNGTPYLAYQDSGNSNKTTVMKFNGSSWEVVGTAGFSASTAYYESLSFSPDGIPYLAYADNIFEATVMKFNGSSWEVVGTADFSMNNAFYASLSFSPDGTPYLAYQDGGNGNKATVMRLGNSGPSVTTGSATALTSSSATLNGAVNDNGLATTVTFDYGTTASYGTNVAATTGGTIAAGTGSTAVSVGLTGLQANTTYHFRVNGVANSLTVNGRDATFTTSRITSTVSAWPMASAITYGQTLASSTLSGGTASVTGTFAWTDATPTPSSAGTSSYSVTFTPTDTNTYTTVSNTVSVTVNKAMPTLAWSNPADITYGTTLSATQLNASATGVSGSLAGAFAYSPASGATLNAGTAQTLSVTFTPTDTADYSTATTSVQINVSEASQTITFTPLASTVTYGVSPIMLHATVNSPLTPTFSVVSGPGTIVGSTLTVTGAGTIMVAADQAGTSNYNKASQVSYSIVVNKATPTLAWPTPADISYGTLLSGTQLNATAMGVSGSSLAGGFVYSPASGATLNTGPAQTLNLTFTPTDTTDYTTAMKSVQINVSQASQTITFTQPTSPITYGAATTLALSAKGGASSNPVTLSVASGPGTLNGSTLTITAAGTIAIDANQAGNTNYSVAPQAQRSVVVSKASSTLAGPATQPVFVIFGQSGTVPVSIAGQYSGAGITAPSGSISYTMTDSAGVVVASGPLPIASGSVSVPVASGFAPGNYTVTTSYSGDGNYNAAATITSQLQVGQIQPTITWSPASSITYGTTLASILTAQAYHGTSTVPGTYSYSINASAVTSSTVLAAGNYTLTVNFTPTDTTTYKTATTMAPLAVNKAAVGAVGLASSVNPLLVQNATVLTATVPSSISTPTGMVTFLDGTTPLNSVPLVNGVATLNVSTLAVGTHSITAAYSGDSNFLPSTSAAVPELVQDFTLNLASTGGASQTILPGGKATYDFNLTPVGGPTLPASVNLSVIGLPAGATYTITPQSIDGGSGATTVALSITTQQQTGSLDGQKPFGRPLVPIALGLLLLPFSRRIRRRANKLTRLTAMLLLVLGGAAGVATLTGCGSSNGFLSQAEKSYTVMVTATSGSLSHSTTTTLIVQ